MYLLCSYAGLSRIENLATGITNYEHQEAYVPQHCVAKVNPATFSYTALATYSYSFTNNIAGTRFDATK